LHISARKSAPPLEILDLPSYEKLTYREREVGITSKFSRCVIYIYRILHELSFKIK